MTAHMEQSEIRHQVDLLGPWFQNIDLRGVPTAPNHFLGDYPRCKWQHFSEALPHDLRGKTVLDIGCNAGFYSLEMKRRGAARVVGIDSDPGYLAQARFAADVMGADIEYRQLDVYDVGQLGETFDLVIFMGVLYHLRHPLLALDLLWEHVVRDTLVFQSLMRGSSDIFIPEPDYPFSNAEPFSQTGYPVMYFVEQSYSHDPTNWWIPNRACVEALLRTAGFVIQDRPESEVYICKRGERRG